MSDNPAQYTQLVDRISAGDVTAETELWNRFKDGVFQIVLRRVRNHHLAEDLTQETYLIVIGRIKKGEVREPEKLGAFVAQVARFHAIERIREIRRRRPEELEVAVQVPDPAPDQLTQLERAEANREIRSLIENLIPRDREVLTRLYLKEEPKDRICADLGLTSAQFDRIVHRARQRYRELYLKRRQRTKRE